MDLKWPEMPSKVNFGHPKWPINLKWPQMRSKVIFRHPKWPPKKKNSISIWNGQKCDRKWISDIQYGRRQPFCQKFPQKFKLRINLKWPEMRSKVKFGHPKWPTSAILSKISKKIKVAYRCEIDRNEIQSEFRTSKMADGSHFVKN